MRNVIATIAVVILLLVLTGVGLVYFGAYYVGSDQPHWPATTWLLSQARDHSIRAHASGITVPAWLDDPARLVTGVSHYADHCALCHGAPGVERGEVAHGMYPRPPNLAEAAASYNPAELFWVVKHGIRMTGMPAWREHSDDELWATVALLRRFPGMTAQDYAKLVAASRGQGGRRGDGREPQTAPTPQPAEKDHDHPAGHKH